MRKDTYRETGYPGIKQRISDNKYIVVIDYGRQMRMNPKTGLMEMKQAKTEMSNITRMLWLRAGLYDSDAVIADSEVN